MRLNEWLDSNASMGAGFLRGASLCEGKEADGEAESRLLRAAEGMAGV